LVSKTTLGSVVCMEDSKIFCFDSRFQYRTGRINDLLDISLGRPRRDSQKNLSSLENDRAKFYCCPHRDSQKNLTSLVNDRAKFYRFCQPCRDSQKNLTSLENDRVKFYCCPHRDSQKNLTSLVNDRAKFYRFCRPCRDSQKNLTYHGIDFSSPMSSHFSQGINL
jgi:hypothetical protein